MANERVILVGAGGISGAWFPGIVSEGLDVVAVVDVRREAALKRIEEFKLAGAVASDDLDQVLIDHRADFAIDLTIPDAHADVTTKCLAAGLHVIGEKPMASTMDQARQMVAAAKASGRMFMVSQSRRWDANHAAIAATLAAGRLGRLTTLNCDFYIGAHFGGFRDEMESPLILDMSIHHFDLARMFVGGNAVSVWCEEFNPAGSWYKGDVAATAVFEMRDNIRFAYRGSWCAEGCHTSWNGDWRIIGTDGTLLYAADQPPHGQVIGDRSAPAFNLPTRPLDVVTPTVEKTGMHGGLDEMLRYLRTGQLPQTNCQDNINSLAMVHAAMRSHRERRRVRIDEV